MDTITVATFNDLAHAQVLKARLDQTQIPARIQNEANFEHLWFVGHPLASIKLSVAAKDYEQAVHLLHEWDQADGALRDSVRCAECGSGRVAYPQYTTKFLFPNLVGVLCAVGVIEKEFYCEDCHNTWLQAGAKPRKPRPHSAPYYFIEDAPETNATPAAH